MKLLLTVIDEAEWDTDRQTSTNKHPHITAGVNTHTHSLFLRKSTDWGSWMTEKKGLLQISCKPYTSKYFIQQFRHEDIHFIKKINFLNPKQPTFGKLHFYSNINSHLNMICNQIKLCGKFCGVTHFLSPRLFRKGVISCRSCSHHVVYV